MAKIDIKRQHGLGYDKAHKMACKLADELSGKFDAKCEWDGPELRFTRPGANGCVRISDNDVRIEVKLGMMLSPLKSKMESIISDELDTLLRNA